MGIVDTAGEPITFDRQRKKKKSAKSERSDAFKLPSLRTADILADLEKATPGQAGAMLRARGDVDRSQALAEPGIDRVRKQAEAEVDSEAHDDAPLELREWAQRHYKQELAKYSVKHGMRHGVPKKLDQKIRSGYAVYRERYYTDLKFRREGELQEARIAAMQAQTAASGRSGRNQTINQRLSGMMGQNPNLINDPQFMRQAQGLLGRTPAAPRRPTSLGQVVAGDPNLTPQGASTALAKQGELKQTRALNLATHKAGLRRGKQLVPDAAIRKVIVSGKNIDKLGKGGEKIDFRIWMEDSYLPIARSLTPEQRATIFKSVEQSVPSEQELMNMLQVPKGKAAEGWFGKKTPPTSKDVNSSFDVLDYVLEALKFRGMSDAKIAQIQAVFSDKLLALPAGGVGG